jgi:hypothetical protein
MLREINTKVEYIYLKTITYRMFIVRIRSETHLSNCMSFWVALYFAIAYIATH